MTTIITRYISATNTKPGRIVADAGMKRRVIIGFPHASANPHREAAIALCKKFDWHGQLVEGGMEHGNAYVFLEDAAVFTVVGRQEP
jgi:hypothetical protein